MCDVGGNSVITMLPYGRKTKKMKQRVWLMGKENCFPAYSCAENTKSIARADISGGERKVKVFHRLQYLLTFLLHLHQIYKLDLFRNSEGLGLFWGHCLGENDGHLQTAGSMYFFLIIIHSDNITFFIHDQFKVSCARNNKTYQQQRWQHQVQPWDCCRRVSNLSQPNTSQALLWRCVSNGVFLG